MYFVKWMLFAMKGNRSLNVHTQHASLPVAICYITPTPWEDVVGCPFRSWHVVPDSRQSFWKRCGSFRIPYDVRDDTICNQGLDIKFTHVYRYLGVFSGYEGFVTRPVSTLCSSHTVHIPRFPVYFNVLKCGVAWSGQWIYIKWTPKMFPVARTRPSLSKEEAALAVGVMIAPS